ASVVIVEDDDWYDPRWLETIADALTRAPLAGERFARYYNVRMRRAEELRNDRHCSLRSTGVCGAALAALRRLVERDGLIYDGLLWKIEALPRVLLDTKLTVGLKGLPGRPGIASGHRDMVGRRDPDLSILRAWIGDDAENYAAYGDLAHMKDTRSLVALRPHPYGTRHLEPGDSYEAPPGHATALIAAGAARAADEERFEDAPAAAVPSKRRGRIVQKDA
ncbi:MAG: hypothetical protein K2Q06_03955, partial [Parvularculaceae bacterium]|nr:hypothetical protein [Parvularculaceae bacterium]